MKAFYLWLFSLLGSVCAVSGQDRIVLRDSSVIECKVEEVAEEKIMYRKWTNLQGPLYSIDKRKVSHVLFQNGLKETFPKPRHVKHKIMFRAGYGLLTPLSIEVNKMGGNGISFGSSFQVSAFLDAEKKISLATTFYAAAGEFKNLHYEGARLFYFAYGFNTKWHYHWLRWPSGSMYSGMGVGFIMENYDYFPNTTIPNPRKFREDGGNVGFQVDAVGIQYAPFRHVGLFSELGLGHEGFFKLGWQIHW